MMHVSLAQCKAHSRHGHTINPNSFPFLSVVNLLPQLTIYNNLLLPNTAKTLPAPHRNCSIVVRGLGLSTSPTGPTLPEQPPAGQILQEGHSPTSACRCTISVVSPPSCYHCLAGAFLRRLCGLPLSHS